jgi:MATE family multidrug resistance protein
MITDIVVNVVNMVVSYVLAVYTPMGAMGVAYGTVAAQLSGLLLVLVICSVRYKTIVLDIVRLLGDNAMKLFGGHEMKRFLSLNGNLFIRSLCFMVVYVGFTSLASKYGDVELAVSTIMMKLFMLFSYFVDGFAYAGEALVGKEIGGLRHSLEAGSDAAYSLEFKGEKKNTSMRMGVGSTVRLLFAWSLGVGILFAMLFGIWSEECYRAMTNDIAVLARLADYTGWLIAMPIISTLAFMWDGVYAGATAGKQIRNAMIYAALGFVVCYLATYWWLGIQGLYIAYFAHLLVRVLYLSLKKDLLLV